MNLAHWVTIISLCIVIVAGLLSIHWSRQATRNWRRAEENWKQAAGNWERAAENYRIAAELRRALKPGSQGQ